MTKLLSIARSDHRAHHSNPRGASGRRPRTYRPRLDSLERRELLAVFPGLQELTPGPLAISSFGEVVKTGLTIPAGVPYILVGTGSAGITNPKNSGGITYQSDVGWEWNPTTNQTTEVGNRTPTLGVDATTDDGTANTFINWGAYSGTHQYQAVFVSDGKPLDLKFFDNPYDDNSPGTLAVDIFVKAGALNLTLTSLAWDANPKGGADYAYTVQGMGLPDNSSIDFFWATGTTEATEIGGPVVKEPVDAMQGPHGAFYVPPADLTIAPQGAMYLIAAADPGGVGGPGLQVLAIPFDPIKMNSATSPTSQDLSFTYNVSQAEPAQPLVVAVYRSGSSTFDPNKATLINRLTVPALDSQSVDSLAVGPHSVTMRDPAALVADPRKEFVFVFADPDHKIGVPNDANHVARFRKFVLGVVTHGFEISGSISPWVGQMATDLVNVQGYDQAIPFDWAAASRRPQVNQTVVAGARMAAQIVTTADALVAQLGNPGDVVDLHLVGHSRGSVVISQAFTGLLTTTDPIILGGYKKMTMLDPHPANLSNGRDYSMNEPLRAILFAASFFYPAPYAAFQAVETGYLAFEAIARDPAVVVPSNVDSADLHYQRTTSSFAFGANVESVINLWGQPLALIVNRSRARIAVTNLTNFVDPVAGLVGHGEVPSYYSRAVVNGGKTLP